MVNINDVIAYSYGARISLLTDKLKRVSDVKQLKPLLTDVLEHILSQFDRQIDYGTLSQIANEISPNNGLGSKLQTAIKYKTQLRNPTYRDLIKSTTDEKSLATRDGLRDVFEIDGIGSKGILALYIHLNSIGIQLFPKGYTSIELDPKR